MREFYLFILLKSASHARRCAAWEFVSNVAQRSMGIGTPERV
jgi:hypothetical protein